MSNVKLNSMCDSISSTIYQLDNTIKELTSRVVQCEINIHNLMKEMHEQHNCTRFDFDIASLKNDYNLLYSSMQTEICSIRSDMDALAAIQNEKSDLENFEQNIDDEINPFINNCWF